MVKARITPRHLAALVEKLRAEFGADIVLLARIVHSVSVLSPEFVSPVVEEETGGGDKMNTRSVSFTLLRFMRLISSPKRPVMVSYIVPIAKIRFFVCSRRKEIHPFSFFARLQLFLDDLQWADDTALDLIHTFLSDTMGSCVFFVGTYRDNEVHASHPIFDLMQKLENSHVPTNKVSLTGLDQEDLNTMISDALCLYPRICDSLSNIVIQKTKGNPFFVFEFIKSLKDRGLLRYNFHQNRWVWDEDTIRAEEITDNVLHLLSCKMNGLSDNVQLLLKVMACFGTRTDESVIRFLSESAEYSGVRDGLTRAVGDGFIERNKEGSFNFVHDKVREAAYNLIPESDKTQV
jgi:predicted ATPase